MLIRRKKEIKITKNILVFVIVRSASDRASEARTTSVSEVYYSFGLIVANVHSLIDEIQYNCHSCRYSQSVQVAVVSLVEIYLNGW